MKKYTGLEIAIIGMSGRFPKANNIDHFWENLKNGVEGISFFTYEEVLEEGEDLERLNNPDYVRANAYVKGKEYFDSAFFNYRPDEAHLMDPQTRVFHECVWEALEDAACNLKDSNHKIGLYVGASTDVNWYIYTDLINRGRTLDDFTAAHLSNARFLATKVSYALGLHGPSVFLDTACSSSLVAIDQACKSLLLRDCTIAVAGGITLTNKTKKGYLHKKGMIHSKDGHCRSFDADSSGTIGSEGAGVVVLKTLKNAFADGDHIHAIIRGTAINNDGHEKVGYTAPSIDGQTEVILMAQKWAKVEPESISYIEAHGTATELGDPIEIEALNRAFGKSEEKYCALGSVKTNLGHLDNAAGVAGFIKTVLALKNRQIPPSLHFKKPNPKINFKDSPFYVNTELQEWSNDKYPLRAGVSSFGIGGTNAHVILEEAPEQEVSASNRAYQLLTFSAKTKTALAAYMEKFRLWLEKNPTVELPDMAYTLKVGRADFPFRKTLVCKSKEEAVELLGIDSISPKLKAISNKSNPKVAFMFSGQGAQYVNMCFDLYEKEKAFKSYVDQCLNIVQQVSDQDLLPIMFGSSDIKDASDIHNTEFTQPALFILEYSLAKLLMDWGVQPDIMIGHSIGEYVAACLSGVFSLEDALTLVVKRGKLMQKTPKGKMLSVSISEKELREILKKHKDVSLAVVNSSSACVVSGGKKAIEEFKKILDEDGHQNRLVKTSHAFHSAMMNEILEEFKKEVQKVTFGSQEIPFVSNLTGKIAIEENILNANYWVDHLRHTVHFSNGLATIFDSPHVLFIEIGPGRTLSSFVRKHASKKETHVAVNLVKHMKEEVDDLKYLLDGVGKLWSHGIELSWEAFYKNENSKKASLPTYSFDKIEYPVKVDAYQMIIDEAAEFKARHQKTTKNFINKVSWVRTMMPNEADELTKDQFNFLIFIGNNEFSSPLIKYLELAGQTVITVKDGGQIFQKLADNDYEIKMDESEGLEKLWGILNKSGIEIHHIIYCRSLSKTPTTIGYKGIEEELKRGYLGLSFLGKSLAFLHHSKRVKITIIDNFLATVTQEDKINPLKSTIKGPTRIIPLELEKVESKLIDIPYPFNSDQELQNQIPKIVNEIFYDSKEDFITYRYHERWIQSFQPAVIKDKLKSNVSILKDKTYIITGGLGGMGLTIAEDFVHQHQANVILLHRSEFPHRKEWKQWLSSHPEQNLTSKKIRQLEEMELTSSKIQLQRIDVSDENQVHKFITDLKVNNNPISGLVWAAGEIDYGGIILNRNKEGFIKYIASKVHGLLLFEKYMEFEKLDFIALFSSMGNVFYQTKFGQVAYNAANEFFENYPNYLRKKTGANVFTINWCDWLDTGMSFKSIQKELKSEETHLINAKIEHGVTPKEGVAIFYKCLENKLPVSYIFDEDIFKKIELLRQNTHTEKQLLQEAKKKEVLIDINSVEQKTIELFSQFFGKEEIGPHDDFFDLGGDSLSGMNLIAKLNKKIGLKLTIGDLYKYPVIKNLCNHIIKNSKKAELSIIPKAPEKPYYKTTAAQKRLFFLYKFDKSSLAYNMPSVVKLKGKFDKEKLNEAFNKLILRHESLRTSFEVVDDQLVQKIAKSTNQIIEFNRANESEVPALIDKFVRPFDLSQCPLIRVGLIEIEAKEHILMLDLHHIVSDLLSHAILINDFLALYNQEKLPDLELQYKDYAEWQQSKQQQIKIAKQKTFWLNAFSDLVPILDLPTDFDRPMVKKYDGRLVHFEINKKQTTQLKNLAKKEGVTMYMIILTIFNILISKISNQDDIVIGSQTAGRQHADVDQIIGLFLNTLILRNNPRGELTFKAFLAELKQNTIQCFNNQNLAYEELIDELDAERDISRNPLFDVLFSYENFKEDSGKIIPGLSIQPYNLEHKMAQFDLALTAVEGEQISLYFEYATHLFKLQTIEKFISYFNKIISTILADQNVMLKDVEIISEKERTELLLDFNSTKEVVLGKETIVSLFVEQCQKTPDAIAINFEETQLSFKELDELSNQLAHQLKDKYDICTGDLVGLELDRSIWMVVSILGILKSGAAYVPIDPQYPSSRKKHIALDSGIKLLISEMQYLFSINYFEGTIFAIDIEFEPEIYSTALLAEVPQPDSLAYIIYTSGSTGLPKGVMIGQRSLVNYINNSVENYIGNKEVSFALYSSISFDLTVTSIFTPLISGNTLFIYKESTNHLLIEKVIMDDNCSIVKLTPSHLKVINDSKKIDTSSIRCLRTLIVGGEELESRLAKAIYDKFGGRIEIYNEYGPTEATVGCMIYKYVPEDSSKSVPIGCPIQNTKLYLLDNCFKLVPVGVKGELYISGVGLALGYIHNEVMTKERFIDNPFSKGQKMYKTGDLAMRRPDGNIIFKGRIDEQVKIRGYRIELGEIEHHLNAYESISESVVILKEKGNVKQLVGYYLAEDKLFVPDIRKALLENLPDYMVPTHFVHLEKMPLTTNGKINRKALPDFQLVDEELYTAPSTEIENQLVEIWAELLGIEKQTISTTHSFFDLGGHSLVAVALNNKIYKTYLIDFPMKDIFSKPILSDMAESIESYLWLHADVKQDISNSTKTII